jgi:diaminopimelate epimerase
MNRKEMIEIRLHFVKMNPVQNMTVFILDQVPRHEQMNVAKKIMNYKNIFAEQVGFIESSNSCNKLYNENIRLQMMGGEFCGNATRSLAALMVHNEYPNIEKLNDGYIVSLEVSGIDGVVKCQVRNSQSRNSYWSKIDMPLPVSIEEFNFNDNGDVLETMKVDFPGITHFIIDDNRVKDRDKFYEIVKKEMDRTQYEAFGIMYYDYKKEFLLPLVHVKATDSLFWERSCASGTSALGVALAHIEKAPIVKKVKQPGGELEVSATWENDKISNISLNGLVEIVAEGIVYV